MFSFDQPIIPAMKFKARPTIFALLVIVLGYGFTTTVNYLTPDQAEAIGFPFRFYTQSGYTFTEPGFRKNFSYPYLLTDLIIALLFTCLVNLLFALILNKNRLKQTAI